MRDLGLIVVVLGTLGGCGGATSDVHKNLNASDTSAGTGATVQSVELRTSDLTEYRVSMPAERYATARIACAGATAAMAGATGARSPVFRAEPPHVSRLESSAILFKNPRDAQTVIRERNSVAGRNCRRRLDAARALHDAPPSERVKVMGDELNGLKVPGVEVHSYQLVTRIGNGQGPLATRIYTDEVEFAAGRLTVELSATSRSKPTPPKTLEELGSVLAARARQAQTRGYP
jgi:hypothetical protein